MLTVTIVVAIFASCLVGSFIAFLLLVTHPRPAISEREWEETVLVYVLGGPAAPGPLTEREACARSLHLTEFARLLADSGTAPDMASAERAVVAARERLEARGALVRLTPPEGSPEGSLPPEHLAVLTPRGAREALEVWARERAKINHHPEASRA